MEIPMDMLCLYVIINAICWIINNYECVYQLIIRFFPGVSDLTSNHELSK